MSLNMSLPQLLGLETPLSIISFHDRYIRLETWNRVTGFKPPTAEDLQDLKTMTGFEECETNCFCVTNASRRVADELKAQILYFLEDHRLAAYRIHHRRVVETPNGVPGHEPGENRLLGVPAELREPSVEPLEQFGMEMETEMPAETPSEIQPEILEEENRDSTCLIPGLGPTALLENDTGFATPTDLQINDPNRYLEQPPPAASTTKIISSYTQLPEPSRTTQDTLPFYGPTGALLISESNSRTITTAQTLLDLSLNPRVNLLTTQAPVEFYRVIEQQYLTPIAPSFRRSTYEEAMHRKEPEGLVSPGTSLHKGGITIALAKARSETLTAAQNSFTLTSITAEPILGVPVGDADNFPQRKVGTDEYEIDTVIEKAKEKPRMQLQKGAHVRTEDAQNQALLIEDGTANNENFGPEFSSRGGKYPSIRPLVTKSAKIFPQTQIRMEYSEDNLHSAESSEGPIAGAQYSIATMADVEDEVRTLTKAITTGPSATSMQKLYSNTFPSAVEAQGNLLASEQNDAASTTMADFAPDDSPPKAEGADSPSPSAENPEELSTCSQSPMGMQMSSLTSQFSLLESVMTTDDVSNQMAIDNRGGGVDDAVEIASRTAAVGAWREALDGDELVMDDDDGFESWGD